MKNDPDIDFDKFIEIEIPIIEKIIQNEAWLEGERRGEYVDPNDEIVQEKVRQIILKSGNEIYNMVIEKLKEASI